MKKKLSEYFQTLDEYPLTLCHEVHFRDEKKKSKAIN